MSIFRQIAVELWSALRPTICPHNFLFAPEAPAIYVKLFPLMTTDSSVQWLQQRLGRFQMPIFVAMLAILYAMLREPIGIWSLRGLFVLHLGLFILWQPVIEGQQKLSGLALLAVALVVGVATWALDGWLLMLWIMLLAGVVGGRVLLVGSGRTRIAYLMALAFLVITLLLLAVPLAVSAAVVPGALQWLGRSGLPVLLVLIFFLPRSDVSNVSTEVIDLINSVVVFLLLAALVLGSLSVMLLFHLEYAQALLQTLFTLGAVLLVLGWVWSPHFGFSGLQNFFARYLLSIGMPAQQWLQTLADLTQVESDPKRFLSAACTDLAKRLDWLRGISWALPDDASGESDGRVGVETGIATEFAQQGLMVKVHTDYPLPPSVIWHINLLTQLLAEFYADKQRANRLRELSYLRAVHETGARLTHDVKNLLQSLQTLMYAAEQTERDGSGDFRELIRRQLPAISNRLATTLDKLRVPQHDIDKSEIAVSDWWERLRQRYSGETWISFRCDQLDLTHKLPGRLFSSVADNLLANATEKHLREPDLLAQVHLLRVVEGFSFSVCDSGSSIARNVERDLLQRPVASDTGLGIGLYQVARQAEQFGYVLEVSANQPGKVCFSLRPRG